MRARAGRHLTVLVLLAALLIPATPAHAAPSPIFKGQTKSARLGVTWWASDKPASTTPGDILVGVVTIDHRDAGAITPPTGWSLRCDKASNASDPPLLQAVYVHLAGASEPASYTWDLPDNSGVVIAILDYANVDPQSPIGGCERQAGAGSSTMVAPALSTSVVHKAVVSTFAFKGSGTTAAPSGLVERFDGQTDPDSLGRAVSASAADFASVSGGTLPARTATASVTAPAAIVGIQFWLRPAFLFIERFPYPNGPIADEFSDGSPVWEVTSGALRADNGEGRTSSPVFRALTKTNPLTNVHVSATVHIDSSNANAETDGAHLMLRYQDESQLYFFSVLRDDRTVIVKKKCTGGPVNGGRYYPMGSVSRPWTLGSIHHVAASARTNADGSVALTLYMEGVAVITATDRGQDDATYGWCAPLTSGRVGIRSDDANMAFDDFGISAL